MKYTPEQFEDFLGAFDEFISALAEHGRAGQAAQMAAARGNLIDGRLPGPVQDQMKAAQDRFDVARDDLVAKREAMGPLRISRKPTEGIQERLWTPGRS